MNRIEMFMELKKDNSKRFRSVVPDRTVTPIHEYWVEDGRLYENYVGSDKSTEIEVRHLIFNDDSEYEEIIRPLWEVIEDGSVYWYVDIADCDNANFEKYYWGDGFDVNNMNNHNMFRTKEEALAKAEEILKVLKN